MYLSLLVLNTRSRAARSDLADRYELHRTLMSAFPADLPEDERMLYRVEDQRPGQLVTVLVQSRHEPLWHEVSRLALHDYLAQEANVRRVAPTINTGDSKQFRLQVNPTVKREGKRHAIYAEDALLEWLQRKSQTHGFTVDPLNVVTVKLGKKHGKRRQQTWHAVQFDGRLQVTDATAFTETLISGIGSGKAFGFGLLSIPYGSA